MTNKELVLTRINELRFTNKHGDEFEQGYNNALDCIEYFINSCLPTEKQPSRGFEEEFNNFCVHGGIRNPNFEGPFGYDGIRKTAIHFANWQKERDIEKACEWLKMCVDVGDEVKMVDGEPEVKSFIQKNLHRIEVTKQIIGEFKKFMDE